MNLGKLRPLGRRNGEERIPYRISLAGSRGLKISVPSDSSLKFRDQLYAYEVIGGPDDGALVFMKRRV
jgi:hypothetical protein